MTALAVEMTLEQAARMLDAAIRDKTYQSTRLGGVVRQYLAWKENGAAARTLEIYEPYLARLCVKFAHLDPMPADVTEDMVLELMAEYPAGSRRLVRTSLSGFFKWCAHPKRSLCRWNPAEDIPLRRHPGHRVYNVFSNAEQAALVKATDSMPMPWVHRLRVLCLIDLGVRKEEARNLRPLDFDPTDRVVMLREGVKNSKQRVVPMGDQLWRALVTFLNRPIPNVRMRDAHGDYRDDRPPFDDDYLFFPYGFNKKSGAVTWADPFRTLSQRGMHSWWAEYIVPRAGIKYRSMHMARHSLGTDLSTAGEDLATIQDWLGHASPDTTKVYVHNSRSRLLKGRSRLDQFRSGTEG